MRTGKKRYKIQYNAFKLYIAFMFSIMTDNYNNFCRDPLTELPGPDYATGSCIVSIELSGPKWGVCTYCHLTGCRFIADSHDNGDIS